jgi:PAS domain S-box-containing protein
MLDDISLRAMLVDDLQVFEDQCLELVTKTLGVSRVFLFELCRGSDESESYFRGASFSNPSLGAPKPVPVTSMPWWMNRLKNGEAMNYSDVSQIPSEPDRNLLAEIGIKSILAVPLYLGKDLYGYIGCDDYRRHREWPLEDIDILNTIARIIAGAIQRKRSEDALRHAHSQTELVLTSIASMMIGIDEAGVVTRWNAAAEVSLGMSEHEVLGRSLKECGIHWESERVEAGISEAVRTAKPVRLDDIRYRRQDDKDGFVGISINRMSDDYGKSLGALLLCTDVTERKLLESQLAQSQKLEAIGHLSAGIAHEINTPIQYVGDNTRFLQDAFADLNRLLSEYGRLVEEVKQGPAVPESVQVVEQTAEEIDVGYLTTEIPSAIVQSLEGIDRVAKIVRAMKEFSHPGSVEKTPTDINRAIENTVTVARNEWKYVSDLTLDLDPDLPLVPCLPDDFNQVILNVIVNAAHAIGDVVGKGTGNKGRITVATRVDGDWAEIRISDTGTGIPEYARRRIFDPFFTTKDVGKGTGQGLAIAHSVVADKHGGMITFETEMGVGTTFIIRLPYRITKQQTDGQAA